MTKNIQKEPWQKELEDKFGDMVEIDKNTVTIRSREETPTREMDCPRTEVDGGRVEFRDNYYRLFKDFNK